MNTLSIKDFLCDPKKVLAEASLGQFVKVDTGVGSAAVIINEEEWKILVDALKLCIDNVELLVGRNGNA